MPVRLAAMITHVVLFNFKDPSDAEAARQKLLGMAGQIPGLDWIEAGLDVTRSERSYHLALITRHPTQADLAAYQVHPVHVEVAGFVKAPASGAAAVDFES